MSSVSRGNGAEVHLAKWLEAQGWLVGSRRHIGGAGDLLAVRGDQCWLVEVKRCKNVWEQFRRADRDEMREALSRLPEGSELWLCNVVGKDKELVWYPQSAWP